MTGVRAGRVLLALYALHLGAQPVTVGMLAATFSVFPMLLSLLAGRFADRFGSRWPLIIGAAGGACGMLAPYLFPGMPALFVAAALNGFAFTFINVALQNLVGLLSTPEQQARNFSNFSLALAVASFVGPLMVGFSIDHAGYGYACLYVVAISLVPVGLLVTKKIAVPQAQPESARAGSIRDALARPGVWRVLATSSLVVTAIDMYPVLPADLCAFDRAVGIGHRHCAGRLFRGGVCGAARDAAPAQALERGAAPRRCRFSWAARASCWCRCSRTHGC